MFAANVCDAGPLGTEQPLVTIGCQKIDLTLIHVERECAESLNRIDKNERPLVMSDLCNASNIVPVASRETDPTHGDDSRPSIARRGEFLEIGATTNVCRYAARLHSTACEIHPRIQV